MLRCPSGSWNEVLRWLGLVSWSMVRRSRAGGIFRGSFAVHCHRLSEEESWIKDTSSAGDGAEKVPWLVGEDHGECADVSHELGAITEQSLASESSFLEHAGGETLVLDALPCCWREPLWNKLF